MLTVPYLSVRAVILRYIRNGCQVIDLRRGRGPVIKYNPELVKQLVAPDLLTKWAPFSL
jgi:hypothetical protein